METKEIKITIPEGYEIDKEKSTFEKIVFRKKESMIIDSWNIIIDSWKDLKKVEGYYINTDSDIVYAGDSLKVLKEHKNVFLNEKYAKSALALAQISQLLPYYDSNVNWRSSKHKYCIDKEHNNIIINTWTSIYHVLAFNSQEEAKRFLEYNEQLVKDYFML